MKILVLNSKDRGGGAAAVARQVAAGYAAAGHDVRWIVGQGSDPADDRVTEIAIPGDGRWGRRLLGAVAGLPPARAGRAWRRLVQAVHPASAWSRYRGWEDFTLPGAQRALNGLPWRPDAIHLHNLHSFNHHTHFDLRLLPALTRNTPTLVTLHDAWLLTGHCAHFVGCDRWRGGCGECPDLAMFPPVRRDATRRNWETKARLYAASRLHGVAVSQWIADAARQSMLAPGLATLRVIPNGIDLDQLRPAGDRPALRAALGLPAGAAVIAFASELGRRNPFRDFAAMQAVCRTVATRLAPRPVVAVELGAEVPQPHRVGNLEVRSPGFIPPAEVARWLQASDVLLHAAVADTLPTIVFEAMATGAVVVATRVGGIPEQVDEASGILVAPGEREAMTTAVHGLLSDEAARLNRSAAARRRVEATFGQGRMVAGYLAALAEITGTA